MGIILNLLLTKELIEVEQMNLKNRICQTTKLSYNEKNLQLPQLILLLQFQLEKCHHQEILSKSTQMKLEEKLAMDQYFLKIQVQLCLEQTILSLTSTMLLSNNTKNGASLITLLITQRKKNFEID